MKRVLLVILCLLCLAGCGGEGQITGEVVKVGLEPDSHGYLILRMENGKKKTVTFDGATAVLSFVDDSKEIGAGDSVRVTLTGEKKYGKIPYAWTVVVESRVVEDGAVLKDGTALDIRDFGSYKVFCLKDGTELLDERCPSGPENVFSGGLYFDDLPEAAQEQVSAYFGEKGLRYDIMEELEEAWRRYQEWGEEFRCLLVSQDITPTAANDHIVAFQTAVTVPGDGAYGIQYREGTVFDRKSGEVIDNRKLFNRDIDEVLETLMDRNGIEEPERAEMLKAFQPEYILLFDEFLEIEFPLGSLPGQENGGAVLGYHMEDVSDLLQSWAVPVKSEE